MQLLAKTRNVLGFPRKRVVRPLRRGERPIVPDVVPFEKIMAKSVHIDIVNRVFQEIDGPAPSFWAFLGANEVPNRMVLKNPMAELKLLKEGAKENVVRIDQVNSILESMVDSANHEEALKIIPRLQSEFGVCADARTEALVAEIAIKMAKPVEALKLLNERKELLSPREECIMEGLVLQLLKRKECLEDGVRLYEAYVEKVSSPSPLVVSKCIVALAKQSFVERAFRVYREARERKQMSVNVICQSALLFAAAKRKEYYREAVDSFRQLLAMNMKPDIFDYTNLMMAAGKVGDMETALSIWEVIGKDPVNKENPLLLTNLFYALSAVEGEETQLSLRQYCSALTDEDILAAAKEIYNSIPETVKTERVNSAYLACICGHRDKQTAIELFFEKSNKLYLAANNVENFLRLCDTIHDLELLERAINFVQEDPSSPPLTKLAFRAIVRTFAYCHQYEQALQWIEKMKAAGHIADRKQLDLVEKRTIQYGMEELTKRFLQLTTSGKPEPIKRPQMPIWRERSVRLAANLKTAYGPNAPKLATTY